MSKEENTYDVIVVGAGLSGLSAAYNLRKKANDLSILILEAKDRIGGRSQTIELNADKNGKKSKFDVGNEWIGEDQPHINGLLKECDLETYRPNQTGKKFLESEKELKTYETQIPNVTYWSLIDLKRIMIKFDFVAKQISSFYPYKNPTLANQLDKMNLEQFLYYASFSTTSRVIIDANIATIFGLPPNQINALFALMYINSSKGSFESLISGGKTSVQEAKIKGGVEQLYDKLLSYVLNNQQLSEANKNQSKILYKMALVKINQNEEDETDLCELVVNNIEDGTNEKFYAKKVISSIPFNQYANIDFKPRLPFYKRNFYNSCKIGNYAKFIVTYEKAFWKEKGFSGEVVSDGSIMSLAKEKFLKKNLSKINRLSFSKRLPKRGPITMLYDDTNSEGSPALVGFITGNAVNEWIDQEFEMRKTEIIESLVRYFGEEAKDFVDYADKFWNNDSFVGGSPTINVISSGVMEDYPRATREPFINVHFCGTESALEWQGHLDGSISSGERAALEVLFSLFCNLSTDDYEKTFYYQKKLIEEIESQNKPSS